MEIGPSACRFVRWSWVHTYLRLLFTTSTHTPSLTCFHFAFVLGIGSSQDNVHSDDVELQMQLALWATCWLVATLRGNSESRRNQGNEVANAEMPFFIICESATASAQADGKVSKWDKLQHSFSISFLHLFWQTVWLNSSWGSSK